MQQLAKDSSYELPLLNEEEVTDFNLENNINIKELLHISSASYLTRNTI